jgi:hypothetical protein
MNINILFLGLESPNFTQPQQNRNHQIPTPKWQMPILRFPFQHQHSKKAMVPDQIMLTETI